MINTDELRQRLEQLVDPTLKMNLKDSQAIKHIGYDENKDLVTLIIAIGKLGGDEEYALRREIAKVVKLDCNHKGLRLQLEESKIFSSIVKKNVTFIGVISGKGGVGKSSIAANLAYALKRNNQKVGIIDADIYGSSIPTILNLEHQKPVYNDNKKIIPPMIDNIQVISTELFTDPGQPVLWRGSLLNSMLNHFFYDVAWDDDTDFIIIDYPPGTGDIALDIKAIVPQTKMILVTTPHPSASHVAVKAGTAAKSLGHQILGVIENMSYYVNPNTNEHEFIFGNGGGREIAEELDTELLGKLEISNPKHSLNIYESDEKNGKIFDEIASILISIHNM